MSSYFYAVHGKDKLIFTSWADAKPFCLGVQGVKYKKFRDKAEAEQWLGIPVTVPRVKAAATSQPPPATATANVYTDGACTKNGSNQARAGIGVYWGPGDPRNVSEPLPPTERHTNNRAELLAIERALDQAKASGLQAVHLYTDSQYSHKALTTWIWGWIRNNWVTTKGTPVENRDLLERIHNKLQQPPPSVEWHYVKAHNGDPGNEEADRLAVQGAQQAAGTGEKRHAHDDGAFSRKRRK